MGFPALYGGNTSLDFANTVDARGTTPHEEHLFDYADLVRWSAYAGLLDEPATRHLLTLAAARPQAAQASYTAALTLREAIFRIFAGRHTGTPPAPADLALIQQGYAAALATARLEHRGDTFVWNLPADHLHRAWWPAAVSAAKLLTTGPLDRIKVCASTDGCQGLFVDTSKNNSRRWCSMDDCGTTAKIRRQTTRRRTTNPVP
ncbi:putative RNA-binding Zn ribbon-like protein [Actinoplanes lutulentus]|uniref:Putative RNA-binding Zn ribbon-like protein n=2 Tax=Actinoplanes lutulentus TaxID=1287878 RepID=A0A327ZD13_9ACTN|nr:putative RNA-binding Zn ribbon-like protein [Actinoplanes lutulentus]